MEISRALIGALAYFSVLALLIAILIADKIKRKRKEKS
jgi:hypothetical protein